MTIYGYFLLVCGLVVGATLHYQRREGWPLFRGWLLKPAPAAPRARAASGGSSSISRRHRVMSRPPLAVIIERSAARHTKKHARNQLNHGTEPAVRVPITTPELTPQQVVLVKELLTLGWSANKIVTLLQGTRATRLKQIAAVKEDLRLDMEITAAKERARRDVDVPAYEVPV